MQNASSSTYSYEKNLYGCVGCPLEHLQQITHPSPQYQKIGVLVMEVLRQITNPIPIIYKFLVITKTHLSLT